MTIAQFIVAYAVSWWLVLFMVLPFGAHAATAPKKGHAPSAPANPRLKKKCRWTTLLALIPTAIIYFVATNARAEDAIYHAGSRCHTPSNYRPSADVNTLDGYGTGDKRVKPADVGSKSKLLNTDSMTIPFEIPSQRYIDRAAQAQAAQNAANGNAAAAPAAPTSINGRNVDLSHSFVDAGKLEIKRNGDALLNGQPITNNSLNEEGCDDAH